MESRGTDAWHNALGTETRSAAWEPPAAAPRVPCLTVVYHPDLRRIGLRATLPALGQTWEVGLSRVEPVFGHARATISGPLADPFLSRKPWRLAGTRRGRLRLVRRASPITLELDGRPLTEDGELSADDLERGAVVLLGQRVVLALHLAPSLPDTFDRDHGLVGEGPDLAELRRGIDRLAGLDAPVLLRGESGTGKELVARALHTAGPRSAGPFVAVNMAAVPATLAASELFGVARGAFTGADRSRPGLFRQAAGGSLFLDEVGDTPAEVQALLLRVLETGEVQAVGADRPEVSDVRVLAATDLDLEAAVADGRFRTPLLHRLAAHELHLAPLRRRREDFGWLLRHFLLEERARLGLGALRPSRPDARPWLPAPLVARLARYPWPGNVRQLRNVVGQLVVAGRDQPEVPVPETVARLFDAQAEATPEAEPARRRPSEVPDEELLRVLRRHRWRVSPAALDLGISRPSLYKRMARCPAIRPASELSATEVRRAHGEHGGDLEAMADGLEVSADGLRRRLRDLGLEPSA